LVAVAGGAATLSGAGSAPGSGGGGGFTAGVAGGVAAAGFAALPPAALPELELLLTSPDWQAVAPIKQQAARSPAQQRSDL
jgi:hypothetical protein